MISTNALAYMTAAADLTNDTQTMPPFVACDALDFEIQVLDEWISTFIGRLQPYIADRGTALLTGKGEEEAPPRSGLEKRIYAASARLKQIRAALDDMNQGLAL